MKRHLSLLLVLVLLSGCQEPVEGASGIGDPLAPELGNGGYDVLHYTIVVDYDPAENELSGSTSIKAEATEPLRRFNLDFQGLEVDSIEVNGSPASYTRNGHELIVTPKRGLARGRSFLVRVEYHGSPVPQMSQLVPGPVGWHRAGDGTVNVINYPDGAATWFPANDHQSDKATFSFEVSVPDPWSVLGPGTLHSSTVENGRARYVYEMTDPMATTSANLHIDTFDVQTLAPVDGVAVSIYFPTGTSEGLRKRLAILPEALSFLSNMLGPFPFDRYSVVLADPEIFYCDINGGLANSEQTVTLLCPVIYAVAENITVHELAHQWLGNSVTDSSSSNGWLYEGSAMYMEWLWLARKAGLKEIHEVAKVYEKGFDPRYPIGQPPAENIVTEEVYIGGALLFHALRLQIGEDDFFNTLRTFLRQYQHSNAGTSDFIEVAEEVSGEELDSFFDAWLYQVEPPALPALED